MSGIDSPTISGGIMAVEKEYFLKVGGFDTDMMIFGGESLEFSFLVWMCGGQIKVTLLPDSLYLIKALLLV